MSALQRRRLRLLARICVYTALGGALYGVGVVQLTEGDFSIYAVLNGAATGIMATVLCAGLDLLVMPTPLGVHLKRAPFSAVVLMKALWYGVSVTLALRIGNNLFSDADPWSWREPRFLFTIGLSFVVALLVSFTLALSEHLGHGVLRSLITGRYHRPREEARVILFVDLVGSTAIAERIGPTQFLRLLDIFASDLAEPVLEHHGTIYRYVGDEVIVTWPLAKGIAEANCVRCVLAMQALLARRAESYRAQFGVVPTFRAALHAGPVVAGEMGAAKREIVFLGDTMNTTARIEGACRELGHGILVSDILLGQLTMPAGIAAQPVGPIALRGKVQPMALYALAATS